MRNILGMKKKGQFQLAGSVVWGIVGFCLTIIVALIVLGLLVNGNFFTSNSTEQGVIGNLSSNVTTGIGTVVSKLPVIFTVVAMVVVLAIIGLLIVVVRKFGMGGGSGSFGQ